jgi:hypothetical protein
VPRQPAPAASSQPAPGPAVDEVAFLPWLFDCAPLTEGGPVGTEVKALQALDATLAQSSLRDDLLPRAAALIPQLLAMLRQSELPVPALAARLSKDVVLTAEVLRLASSPYYRAQGAITDLAQAIALIGEQGLQTVVARVVLKPMYEAPAGTLAARAAPRLWDYAEALARQTAATAGAAGQATFDGYLAGLLYGTGWTVALRVLARDGIGVALPPTAAFADACGERAHGLFGLAAQRWNITPGFSAFAADARVHPLAAGRHPLSVAVNQAMPLALADVAAARTAT